MTLRLVVLTQYQRVADGQTDGHGARSYSICALLSIQAAAHDKNGLQNAVMYPPVHSLWSLVSIHSKCAAIYLQT